MVEKAKRARPSETMEPPQVPGRPVLKAFTVSGEPV